MSMSAEQRSEDTDLTASADLSAGTDQRLDIGFATVGDARDVRYWSGTPFYMARALAAGGAEVKHLGPFEASLLKPFKAYSRLRSMVGATRPSPFHAGPVVRQVAASAAQRVAATRPGLVFAPAGSAFAWSIPDEVPVVYASDATFQLVDGYHPNYRSMPARARSLTNDLERRTIERANLLLYPSDWAAGSAVADYGADPDRVHVIPWGANLDRPPDREVALRPRTPGPWRLLLAGVDWYGKGADTAVDALQLLRGSGLPVELVVCGTTPPDPLDVPGLTIISFLDKRDPDQRARFDELFLEADLFVLPTRGDCYGIAFCEAAAFGVPSIAPATGGVPGAVTDGETGLLLPEDADGEAYAWAIAELLSDSGRLDRLRESSRDAFEERLNWTAWADRVLRLMGTL